MIFRENVLEASPLPLSEKGEQWAPGLWFQRGDQSSREEAESREGSRPDITEPHKARCHAV